MATPVLFALIFVVASIGGVQSHQLRLSPRSYTTFLDGRLEIYYSNKWIPFIIDFFSMFEADLACKSLGYNFALRYATVGAMGFTQSTTNYSASLGCTLNDTVFSACAISRKSNFSHSTDVGLQCTNLRSSLRLLSTSFNGFFSGRLQIRINNTWGTVCSDDFGSLQAGIACRQLGFSGYSSYTIAGNSYLSSSYGSIWLDNLNQCNYNSTDLRSCTRAVGIHNCDHSKDVILTCYGAPTQAYLTPSPDYSTSSTADYTTPTSYSYLTSNDVRLLWIGSTPLYDGRLEIYYYTNSIEQYSWMSFCISGFNKRAADLACKQLGYDHADRYSSVESEFGHINITKASTSYISSVYCSSSDLKLQNCTLYSTNDGLCSDDDRVALICSFEDHVALLAGFIALMAIGPICSVCSICIVLLSAGITAAVYHKKHQSRVRTRIVAQNLPDLSDLVTLEKGTLSAAPPLTPSPMSPKVEEEQEGHHAQKMDIVFIDGNTHGEETKPNLENLYTSADHKNLTD